MRVVHFVRMHSLLKMAIIRARVAPRWRNSAPWKQPQVWSARRDVQTAGLPEAAPRTVRQSVDYTALAASVTELQSWIPSRVEQVVQWREQSVALRLKTAEAVTWVHCSWHPVAARLHCGERPPRGAASEGYSFGSALHKFLRGLILTTAEMPVPFERVVQLRFCESLDAEMQHALWCEVMGRYSNLVMTNADNQIELCSHQIGTRLSSLRQLQTGRPYQVPPAQSGRLPPSVSSKEEFAKVLRDVAEEKDIRGEKSLATALVQGFQGVSPCLAQDLLTKAEIDVRAPLERLPDDRWKGLFTVFQDWLQRLSQGRYEPTLSTESNRFSLIGLPGVWHTSTHSLLESYYSQIESAAGLSGLSHRIRSVLKKSFTRLEAKKKKLQQSLKEGENADATQKMGDLIIANLYSTVLKAEDWETGEEIEIRLDPSKSVSECAQDFFKRAKKMRRAQRAVQPLLEQLEQEVAYLKEVAESVRELDESDDEDDDQALQEIQEELIQGGYMKPPSDHHLAVKAAKKAAKQRPISGGDPDGLRQFTSPNGFRILVGRNNRQNDLLSKSRGKPGDLWFHARGVPGAHVLLKLDGKTQAPEEQDVCAAAELAAYYSKAREAGKVPVSVTGAENVSKPRGAPPGLVQIKKERTLQVRPSESLAYKKTSI